MSQREITQRCKGCGSTFWASTMYDDLCTSCAQHHPRYRCFNCDRYADVDMKGTCLSCGYPNRPNNRLSTGIREFDELTHGKEEDTTDWVSPKQPRPPVKIIPDLLVHLKDEAEPFRPADPDEFFRQLVRDSTKGQLASLYVNISILTKQKNARINAALKVLRPMLTYSFSTGEGSLQEAIKILEGSETGTNPPSNKPPGSKL